MNRVKVKICGLMQPEDCQAVNQASVDFAGFVLAPSRRHVAPEKAADLIRLLLPGVLPVGVFVDESETTIVRTTLMTGIKVIQLHGPVQSGRIGQLRHDLPAGIIIWQRLAVPLNHPATTALAEAEKTIATSVAADWPDCWLLDSSKPGASGGTGESFDWSAFRAFSREIPVILAGGLDPDNVAQAIAMLQPAIVDCSSGVETSGKKDAAKISLFTRRVRQNSLLNNKSDALPSFTASASNREDIQ